MAHSRDNKKDPKVDRNSNQQIIRDGFISIGGDMLGNLFQEFLAKKLTSKGTSFKTKTPQASPAASSPAQTHKRSPTNVAHYTPLP